MRLSLDHQHIKFYLDYLYHSMLFLSTNIPLPKSSNLNKKFYLQIKLVSNKCISIINRDIIWKYLFICNIWIEICWIRNKTTSWIFNGICISLRHLVGCNCTNTIISELWRNKFSFYLTIFRNILNIWQG